MEQVASWGSAPLRMREQLVSELCKTAHFSSPWYDRWCREIKEATRLHRKQWEYAYILQALFERGCLAEGKRGLGFAVGTEPLPALMATYGCDVLASDLDYAAGLSLGWDSGGQLCEGTGSLNQRGICPEELFAKKVQFRPVDMNAIPSDLSGFDFNWSSCSFEHLGSIDLGLKFLQSQLDTLKPGGFAIHTTEFNISSEYETVEEDPNTVIFRRSDLADYAEWLLSHGHTIEVLDFSLGSEPTDFHVDLPPYCSEPHLRLLLHGYVVTSVGFIVQKGNEKGKRSMGKNGLWSRLFSK
jgi:SAM-dependent methyltransferase